MTLNHIVMCKSESGVLILGVTERVCHRVGNAGRSASSPSGGKRRIPVGGIIQTRYRVQAIGVFAEW